MVQEERKSDLFNYIAWMGMLATEDCRIRNIRSHNQDLFTSLDLSYDDVERVGYFYPHVAMPLNYKDKAELWVEDHYLNPKAMTWVETDTWAYCIIDRQYDEVTPVKCYYNPGILYRYSNVVEDDNNYAHVKVVHTNKLKYNMLKNAYCPAYYITDDQIKIPEMTWLDENTLQFRAPYKHNIDFFICSNLVSVVQATANTGITVIPEWDPHCYQQIIVDHDPSYPIDTRFYPFIKVDKDAVIRVLNDSYDLLLAPNATRLMTYPEYYNVTDPYNTDDEHLKNLEPVDDVILSTDSDEEILEKFSRISAYCYRMWEKFPTDTTMQNDFCICDNSHLNEKAFITQKVSLKDGTTDKICSMVPCEPYRDIIFYNGTIFSDYITKNIKRTNTSEFIENDVNGTPRYLIDPSYDIDKFTIIKFNTDRDSTIMNIGDYIDIQNVAQLHYKLNRFYRNILVIRQQLMDCTDEDYVRVATEQPTVTDDYLWFELLVNAVPEMFHTNPIQTIELYGLDPKKIPHDVAEGAYKLDLDPEGGPQSYTDLLMTYFKLSKNKQKYLTLQYGDGVDDPRIQSFRDVKVGSESDSDKLNQVLIEDPSTDPTYTETKVDVGDENQPDPTDKHRGDLYFQTNGALPPEPTKENIHIDEISYGPNVPEQDEHFIWIDTDGKPVPGSDGGELPPGYYPKDSLDSETETIGLINDINDVKDPEKNDYMIDAIHDTFTPEEEGDSDIFNLINSLNMDNIEETRPGNDILQGITDAISNNSFVDEIENPYIGQFAMDGLTYEDTETGQSFTMQEIAAMPRDQKLSIINKLITDDDIPEDMNTGDLWISYLSKATSSMLNTIVYKVLLTSHLYNINQAENGDIAIIGGTLPTTEEGIEYGPHNEPNDNLLIQTVGNTVLTYRQILENNVNYIMSWPEPEDPENGLVWMKMPASTLHDVIKNVLSSSIMEIGHDMPEGEYFDDGYDIHATVGLDYHAHGTEKDGLSELFQERITNELNKVYYGNQINPDEMKENDIWYEFLDTINNRVAYSDEYSMVIRVDERLILLNFGDKEDITAFAFDDILLNFRGTLGIKYLSIIADLINSGEISLSDLNIFYKRLITFGDIFDPKLKRLYTGTSHVITLANIDSPDYEILYSTNVGRFRMDYSSPDTINREREAAYRMCIDLRNRDFAFLQNRMLIFVNGKYIPNTEYYEDVVGLIQLTNFNEIIATVDILYNKKDLYMIQMKHCAYPYWYYNDTSEYIQRPSQYNTMEPIYSRSYTKKGYYDVLLNEYIFNGRLQRLLNYITQHPDEKDEVILDLKRKFHAISDIDLSDMDEEDAKIVLSADTDKEVAPYTIQEMN